MSVTLYTNYFVERLTNNNGRLKEGALGQWEYYENFSHDVEMNINDSRLRMTYSLRFEIADKEKNALEVPNVIYSVTFDAFENKKVSIISPSASKTVSYKMHVTKTEFGEQVQEAIDNFKNFIDEYPVPQLEFDFWPQTAKFMKQFDKQSLSIARDNSDIMEMI